MYIPTLINVLQVSLSPLVGIFGFGLTSNDIHPVDRWSKFGVLTPYHDRPYVHGVRADLPADCTVDQLVLLHRHGSRGPEGEEVYINKLVETLNNSTIPNYLPPDLRFLKHGYKSDLVPKNLTIIGRQQLFDHGVEFALHYPGFSTDFVLSSTTQRVIDSASYFTQGMFGRNVDIVTVDKLELPVNWILPWESCPRFSPWVELEAERAKWAKKYIPLVRQRLSALLPGIELSDEDIRGALNACPYDLAAHNASPWCGVFEPHELAAFDYESDLISDGISGYISRNDTGPILGSVYINKLIERFSNTTGDAQELYLEFGHDVTILLVLSAMNLNKDVIPLTPEYIPPNRKFRGSEQSPFAARMIWEKFTCKNSFQGPQVRLLLNGEAYPLAPCQKSRKDVRFGTCSLSEFVKANAFSTDIRYGDETWNAACVAEH
ncbi:phosphoglycerate mutase-like protein [Pisolithus croceorrhizus]|nr:phosphoglycerate mutase-like protein [Pisolithus croceorrhizus]KAI6160527.1 phosphoglycerate mutase-like protein [Pisolithus thermaeus]